MESRAGRFVRPLLGVRKEELSAYLGALGEGWKEDATNAEPTYKRNRIRLQLLPLLEELAGGGLLERLGAASEQSAQLREWLDQAHASNTPLQHPAPTPTARSNCPPSRHTPHTWRQTPRGSARADGPYLSPRSWPRKRWCRRSCCTALPAAPASAASP